MAAAQAKADAEAADVSLKAAGSGSRDTGGGRRPAKRVAREDVETELKRLLTSVTKTKMHPLHVAASSGGIEVLSALLSLARTQEGWAWDLDAKDWGGNTAVHLLCKQPGASLEAIETLTRAGASVRAPNRDRQQPLHLAVCANNLEVVKQALLGHADINCRDKSQQTPLHYLVRSFSGWEPLCTNPRASEGDLKQHRSLIRLLLMPEHKAEINARDVDGKTPLYLSVESGCPDLVGQLLKRGADVQLSANTGELPVEAAVRLNSSQTLKELINHGALEDPARLRPGEVRQRLMRMAFSDGTRRDAAEALVDFGRVGLQSEDTRWATSTLTRFAGDGDLKLVKLLLHAGAPPSGAGKGGARVQSWDWQPGGRDLSPLQAALESGSVAVAKVLVEHGAMVGNNTEWAADFIKAKATERAQDGSQTDTDMVSLLLKAGASVPIEYKTDPTVVAAMGAIREELKDFRSEVTTILQLLPNQLQEGFRMVQGNFSKVCNRQPGYPAEPPGLQPGAADCEQPLPVCSRPHCSCPS